MTLGLSPSLLLDFWTRFSNTPSSLLFGNPVHLCQPARTRKQMEFGSKAAYTQDTNA